MGSKLFGWVARRRSSFGTGLALVVVAAGTAAGTSGAMLHLNVVNTATTTTTLRSGVNGTVLQVNNTNSAGGTSARGLGIIVPAGRAPISVNSTAGKATNLHADKLDGLEGTQLQRRVTGSCAAGSAIRSVSATGTVTCEADDINGGNAQTLDGRDSSEFLQARGVYFVYGSWTQGEPDSRTGGRKAELSCDSGDVVLDGGFYTGSVNNTNHVMGSNSYYQNKYVLEWWVPGGGTGGYYGLVVSCLDFGTAHAVASSAAKTTMPRVVDGR